MHPNVLQLIGIANMKLERQPAIITPWLPKRNIVDCIASSNPDFAQRIKWVCQLNIFLLLSDVGFVIYQLFGIAQGVDYLHENKIIHGDLKGASLRVYYASTPSNPKS